MSKDLKITSKEFEKFSHENVTLSDMDYGYNSETKVFDIPKLEWDSSYGTHWTSYNSEEDREFALDQYQMGLDNWVIQYRKLKNEEIVKFQSVKKLNTIGGMFPELEELKSKMK